MTLDPELKISCPECGSTIKTSLGALAKESTVRCGRGHRVNLQDKGRGGRQVVRALDDLEKRIKRLGQ